MIQFFHKIIDVLDRLDIPYMLSGSIAMGIYAVPRSTRDFDFVIHLKKSDVVNFSAEFKNDYYCDIDAINDALTRHSIFNIIDPTSGYKADFIILKPEEYRQAEFNRRKQIDFLDKKIYIVSAEDLILSKLIWIQDYQMAVQMEDIKTILSNDSIDFDYISTWIEKLDLKTFDLFPI